MASFDRFVFSASGAITIFFVLALWVWLHPKSRAARGVLVTVALGYFLASIYGVSHQAAVLLAGRYSPMTRAEVPSGRTALVLLGSSTLTAKDADGRRFPVLDRPAAMRVIEAHRIYRLVQPEWVISSGGNADPDNPDEATGTTMRNALVSLGVPAEKMLVETGSRTTRDEAVIVAKMLEKLNPDHVVLVTTRLHMPRSLGAFRAAGVDAIPAIAREPQYVDRSLEWFLPSEDGFREAEGVVHELLGIAYYAVRGWYQWAASLPVNSSQSTVAFSHQRLAISD